MEFEGEVLKVFDTLFIDAPYNENCCRSTNEVVLNHFLALLRDNPLPTS